MSLRYLLDGYNIIHQIPGLANGKLEDQRKNLSKWIETHRPQGSLNNEVIIVFDGKSEFFSQMQVSEVKVVFSQDESADEKIKRMVSDATHKKSIVVVTNDREIQYAVRAQGAKTMSVEIFMAKAIKSEKESPSSAITTTPAKSGKNISESLKFEITQELQNIWLRSKKNK